MSGTQIPTVTFDGLSKSYGSNQVLHGVSFRIEAGTIHGLLGANGAGKSTLIKILSGLTAADDGTITVLDRRRAPGSVGFIHQDLGLVDALTVRENLQLGRRPPKRRWLPLIDDRAERQRAAGELARVDLDVDPETMVGDLGLGQKSLLAVARLFAERSYAAIVLDETTAGLTSRESDWLLREVRRYVEGGGAALVVSHRINEIAAHYDEVTVLRNGRIAYSGATPDIGALHELMAGPAPVAGPERRRGRPAAAGEPVLRMRRASAESVGPVDLEVRSGEVVGLIGPLSSNLYEVGHLAARRRLPRSGEVVVRAPSGEQGSVGFLGEDRARLGNLVGLDVVDNLTIGALGRFSRAGLLRMGPRSEAAAEVSGELDGRPRDPTMLIEDLSGGNQQKVLLGRASLTHPPLYVLLEPTRGVDVPTRRAIYGFVDRISGEGAAVVVVTIDVDDVLAVADRVGFVEGGRIVEVRERDSLTAAQILERL